MNPIAFEATESSVLRRTESPRWIATGAMLTFFAYYAGAKLGLALTSLPHPISILWPPNAIMMGILLITPPRSWLIFIVAALPAHVIAELQSAVPITMVMLWFVSNILEALIGAALLHRLLGGAPRFDGLHSIAVFLLAAVLAAPCVSSFLDAAFVVAAGWSRSNYWQLWCTRFASNVLANLTIVPVIVTTFAFVASKPIVGQRRLVEGAALVVSLILVSFFVFDSGTMRTESLPALVYLPMPLLVWAALRFGPSGTSIAFLIVAFAVIWGTAHDRGPFISASLAQSALPVQLFLIFIGVMLLTLSGVIEQNRRTERSLRSSEERFAVAFHANPEAVAITRMRDDTILDVNERWCRLFGHARELAVGRSGRELSLYKNGDQYAQLVRSIADRTPIQDQEIDFRTREGAIKNGMVSTAAVDIDGEECTITTIRDLTELKRTISKLRRTEERNRLVLCATSDVIFDWKVRTDRFWWNDKGEVFFGKCPDAQTCTLSCWVEQVHPDDREPIMASLNRVLTDGEHMSDVKYRLRRLDGSCAYVHTRSLALRDERGQATRVIGSLTDITDHKRAEEANLQLVHVSRVAVLGELTASIAHEINQPLGAILSNADSAEMLLNEKEIRVEELRQIVADIRNDDMRAGEVIRHIGDLLRKREMTMRPFDLNRAIGDVLNLVSADLARHRVVVEAHLKPLPIIVGDQVHIQQVVLNLIFNAVDAMADVPVSRRRLCIRTMRLKPSRVEVSVADSGPGISADHADRLFESFFTTKDDGMGLGLSIARSIVEAHGGTISAEARPGQGALFRFELGVRA